MTTNITKIGKFVVKELIGQGSFSEVYNCTLPECGNVMFAIKRLLSTSSAKKILNEVLSLLLLKDCPNTIPLLGVTINSDSLNLIFPSIESDDFTLFIRDCRFKEMQSYMRNLLLAVSQMHSKGIIHRDIKPRNFLFSREKGTGILIDFGLAEMKDTIVDELLNAKSNIPDCKKETELIINLVSYIKKTNRQCSICHDASCTGVAHTSGTQGFRAPEVLTKVIHQTTAIDIWSCGIVFMCILSRRYPLFYQKSSQNEYYELMEFCSLFGSNYVINGLKEMNRSVENLPFTEPGPLRELFLRSSWDEWVVDISLDLLYKMVVINPANRITADDALKHPFFMM